MIVFVLFVFCFALVRYQLLSFVCVCVFGCFGALSFGVCLLYVFFVFCVDVVFLLFLMCVIVCYWLCLFCCVCSLCVLYVSCVGDDRLFAFWLGFVCFVLFVDLGCVCSFGLCRVVVVVCVLVVLFLLCLIICGVLELVCLLCCC